MDVQWTPPRAKADPNIRIAYVSDVRMADDTGLVLCRRFELLAAIGAGATAAVYRALDRETKSHVAIKVLHPRVASFPENVRRFRREAHAVSRLHHPNVVRVLDFDEDPERGVAFLVMDFLEGGSLSDWLDSQEAPPPLAQIVPIVTELFSALAAAHAQGIVHRDLKPENVMVVADPFTFGGERVKVLDFGIAKLTQGQRAFVTIADMIGTPAYMAPEQALGRSVDARADQFALAAILYEMLTGRAAFASPEEPAMVVLSHVLHDEPPALLPPGPIARAIYQALRKDPTQRFPSMG